MDLHETSSLNPTPADAAQHLMPISRLMSEAFANGQYVDEISRKYIGSDHYDWNTTRLIWDGDRLVHHWGVWGYPMRVGSARLKVAGIGAVVTVESHRKRGLMTGAAHASIQAMRENGYDLSILRGRHYVRFGYARAWNYVTYRLKADEIPPVGDPPPYETLGPDRMDAINTLYNQSHAALSGTAVRPTYRMLAADDMSVYGWLGDDGMLEGYVRAVPMSAGEGQQTLQCLEAAGDPVRGLAVLASLFQQGGYETLTFFTLSYRHPILKIIRRGACIIEDRYFDISGWRVRLINLQSALEKLRPALETRLQNSRFADWSGALHLDAGEQHATLEIAAGTAQITDSPPGEHIIHGGPAIARLLIGSDDPVEIMEQDAMHFTGQAADLVRVLFPNMYPMLSHWDEY